MVIIFVVLKSNMLNLKKETMDEKKFETLIEEVVNLMLEFRTMADKSDKRILRDTIRAIVKELTRV